RTYETRSKKKESKSLERRQSGYRKHLFSESNNENTSPIQSEKSWILDSQIQAVPKSADYTRKRPRVRSNLKVLPVSSVSSGSDYESKKEGKSRQRVKRETRRKKSTFTSKGDDLPTVELADETLSEDLEGSPLTLSVTARSAASDVGKATQKFLGTPDKLSREEESTKRKDSDILSGTIIKKPKFSSLAKDHLFSEVNHTSNKASDSVKEEVEFQKGLKMDDSVDDVFISKMLHEDLSDSGVIFAFESFIGQLKKLFWSRYKRIELNTQDALRSSERNLSALLNQIHKR
ncbi:SYC2L protein, partial [Spelaeornis formosus]|nr:SYC2L protein [Elachura formosa]